jgi:hypothetical protein
MFCMILFTSAHITCGKVLFKAILHSHHYRFQLESLMDGIVFTANSVIFMLQNALLYYINKKILEVPVYRVSPNGFLDFFRHPVF